MREQGLHVVGKVSPAIVLMQGEQRVRYGTLQPQLSRYLVFSPLM